MDQEYMGAPGAGNDEARTKYGISYPELCSEFLAALSRTAKSAALYTMTHPLVTQSLGRAYAALGEVIDSTGGGPLTVSYQNDSWIFSGRPVQAAGLEAANLAQLFKAHYINGIVFDPGVRVSELAALCGFLGGGTRGQQAPSLGAFLKSSGVTAIRQEESRYVRDTGRMAAQESAPSEREPVKEVRPRPAAVSPAPELTPRPSASYRPAPRFEPAPEPLSPEMFPRRPSQRPAPVSKPAAGQQGPARSEEAAVTSAGADTKGRAAAPPAAPKGLAAGGPGGGAGKGAGGGSGAGSGAGTGSGAGEGTGSGTGGGTGTGTGAGRGEGGGGGEGAGAGKGGGLGELLTKLIDSAIKDPNERVKVYEDALRTIKESMGRQIAQATKELAAEKKQILDTRTRTEQVLSHVAEGKVIVDKDGRILMMNTAAEEMSGRKLFEVVGKHISEHLNPAEHILTLSKDMDLAAGKTPTGEVSEAGDEDVRGALRRSMALLQDDQGRVVGAYMTLPEVTKYRDAQKLQEEFLSRVTHDLQSPLSSISSALEMLSETAGTKLDGDENNFLAISIRNSRRLSEMIRGILDFSKLQSGKMPVHPEPCMLGPILKEGVEGLMPWARTKGIKLTLKTSAQDIPVLADHPRIVQVLSNLISNAIKSTASGGSIVVAAARAAVPEPCAMIGVRDNGPGISKKDLDRIFERFVQLENGGKREGVGLGLSIVKEFVAMHKGRIWAESEPGKGTTFYFTLPLSDEKLVEGAWPGGGQARA
ncbi:MAG: ATP-binding protein [Elusimicrobia bacterium]|nr:ATP-binding protein [Elusimicrobiota bacterium]